MAGQGHGAVARQPVGPVFITGVQRLFDQQPAKARAVDEQVACDASPAFERDRGDKAALAIQLYIIHPPFLPHDAALLGIFAQETGIGGCVDVIGVIDRRQIIARQIVGLGELAEVGRHRFGVEHLNRALVALRLLLMPDVVERKPGHLIAVIAKGVDVAVSQLAPVDELNAQLEAALHCGEHFRLVDFEQPLEIDERGNSRLAHPDCADGLAFDQRDRQFTPLAQTR